MAAAVVAGLAGSGCGLNISSQAEARDEWKRSFEIKPGGELEVKSANGRIHVEAADVARIEVVATRIVRAPTDEAAKAALAEYAIAETVAADRVVLDANPSNTGFNIGLSRRAEFDIKVPRGVLVILKSSNGEIRATGISGLRATATNGGITAKGIDAGALETTNGSIDVDLTGVAADGLTCETTNGGVTVTLPRDVKARLSVRVTNGSIDTSGLQLAATDQSRRRLEATIGGGGPMVRVETTNGWVNVRGK